jgi:hypothetical protein
MKFYFDPNDYINVPQVSEILNMNIKHRRIYKLVQIGVFEDIIIMNTNQRAFTAGNTWVSKKSLEPFLKILYGEKQRIPLYDYYDAIEIRKGTYTKHYQRRLEKEKKKYEENLKKKKELNEEEEESIVDNRITSEEVEEISNDIQNALKQQQGVDSKAVKTDPFYLSLCPDIGTNPYFIGEKEKEDEIEEIKEEIETLENIIGTNNIEELYDTTFKIQMDKIIKRKIELEILLANRPIEKEEHIARRKLNSRRRRMSKLTRNLMYISRIVEEDFDPERIIRDKIQELRPNFDRQKLRKISQKIFTKKKQIERETRELINIDVERIIRQRMNDIT